MINENMLSIIDSQIKELQDKIDQLKDTRRVYGRGIQVKIDREVVKKIKIYASLNNTYLSELVAKFFNEIIKNFENETGQSLLSIRARNIKRAYSKKGKTPLQEYKYLMRSLKSLKKRYSDLSKLNGE